MTKRELRGSIESIPKQELFERIYHWLENGENERDNTSYQEESNDNLSSQSDFELEVTNGHHLQNTNNIHPIEIQEEYLQGCLRRQTEPHEFIRIYHNKIWMPQATLV